MAQGWQCWGLGAFCWRLRSASLTFARSSPGLLHEAFPVPQQQHSQERAHPSACSVLCAQKASSIVAWQIGMVGLAVLVVGQGRAVLWEAVGASASFSDPDRSL